MQISKYISWNSLNVLNILAVFCLAAPAAQAQYQLQVGETKPIYSLTSTDLIIPEGIDTLALTLKGGDGGDAYLNGATCDKRIKGGAGATIAASFVVGYNDDQLQPGGRLRVFVGSTGNTDYKLCAPSPTGVYGGGGGSSAVLYLPPGEDFASGTWDLLAVAGAGGGGARPSAGFFHRGNGGNAGSQGDAACGASESYHGDCGACASEFQGLGLGGAGTACATGDDIEGGAYNMTLAVKNAIASELVLKASSEADKTGGTYNKVASGGNGFTGGGAGHFGGGGGGGYSGGGSCSYKKGGGGGSFVSAKYVRVLNQLFDGGDGAGTQSNGYVTISTKIGHSYIPAETVYTTAQGRILLQSGNFVLTWHSNGNLVLKEGDGAGNWTVNWASNTANEGNELNFQPDGNLVIYSNTRLPLWSSNTWANQYADHKGGQWLYLSPQGKFCVFNIDRTLLWSVDKDTEVGR